MKRELKWLELERVDKAEERCHMLEVECELQRRHEIELKRLETEKLVLAAHVSVKPEVGNIAKLSKLFVFQDGEDELISYSQRFKQFATMSKWEADQ